jgi:glycosyltransferase involved in cell wall biosynthesis
MERITSVIVPTFNKAAQLENTLEHLLNQDLPDNLYEVVVVDNNSIDKTKAVLDRLSGKYLNLRYVSEKKKGPASARNRGIIESRGDLLIFIDDDMRVTGDHIRMHWEFHEKLSQPLCVVGRWRDNACYNSKILGQYYKTHLQIIPSENEIVDQGLSLASGNFSIYRSTLELVKEEGDGLTKYYDERFLVLEDGDIGLRLEAAGVKFFYTKEICVFHCHAYSTRQIMNRVYSAGYYQYLFDLKHPKVRRQKPIIIIKSKNMNTLLLLSGMLIFILGYLLQWISPLLMLKGVGACLLFKTSRGYQKAMHDFAEAASINRIYN